MTLQGKGHQRSSNPSDWPAHNGTYAHAVSLWLRHGRRSAAHDLVEGVRNLDMGFDRLFHAHGSCSPGSHGALLSRNMGHQHWVRPRLRRTRMANYDPRRFSRIPSLDRIPQGNRKSVARPEPHTGCLGHHGGQGVVVRVDPGSGRVDHLGVNPPNRRISPPQPEPPITAHMRTGNLHEMSDQTFTYIWEYRVPPENTDQFHQLYGSHGAWVQLF
jgi:hypothetical protein